MKEIKDLLNEVMSDDYLKGKIKEAFTEQIISTIKYDSEDLIRECLAEIFNDEFKMTVKETMKDYQKNIKKTVLDGVKEQISSLKSRITFKFSRWDFEKIFRDNLHFKDED
jgi:hypothetical protein